MSDPEKRPTRPQTRAVLVLLFAGISLLGLLLADAFWLSPWVDVLVVVTVISFAILMVLSFRLLWQARYGDATYPAPGKMWLAISPLLWALVIVVWLVLAGYTVGRVMPEAAPLLIYALVFLVIVLVAWSRAMQMVRRRRVLLILGSVEKAMQLNLPLPRMILAAAQSEKGMLRSRLLALHDRLDRGEPLDQALGHAVPEILPDVIRVISAGQQMGCLPHVLGGLIRRHTARVGPSFQAVGIYGIYPLIIVAMVWLASLFVFPRFLGIFRSYHLTLPPTARFLVSLFSNQSALLAILFAVVALLPLGRLLAKAVPSFWRVAPFDGAVADRIIWWMPVAGGLVHDRGMADLCDLVAVGVGMGHPLTETLPQAAAAQASAVMRRRTTAWAEAVAQGQPIYDAARSARMPHLFVSMLATTRDSDGLVQVLGFLWRYYEFRFVRARAILQAAYVPAVVFLMGALVAILGLSLFQPLTMLSEHLSQNILGGF